jgi:hypothetical protein
VPIIYPLTLPAAPGFRTFNLNAVDAVGEVISPFSGQAQEQQWQDQHWELDVALPFMRRQSVEAGQWIAFLNALHGKYGSFLVGDPAATAPQGSAGLGSGFTSALVNGAVASGVNSLPTRGWAASQVGVLLRGDYLQIGTGTTQRLYQVLTDASSNASGQATLDIFPCIREALSDGNPLTLNNTAGCFRLASNKRTWEVDQNRTCLISFKAREAI